MTNALWILAGIALLYGGAEGLIHGAYRLAVRIGITPLVAGLTVVSFGTSMPEAVASFIAQVKDGLGNLAMGNVVGSNIANVGLIAGLSALAAPMPVSKGMRFREAPIMLGVLVIFSLFLLGDTLGRLGGSVLLAVLILYIAWQVIIGKKEHALDPDLQKEAKHVLDRHWSVDVLIALCGAVALIFGGWSLIKGAIGVASHLGLSDRVIGLTIVAIGTSLPELATSVIAAIRGHAEIALGNVVGSNVFNTLFIAGGVAVISPISFVERILLIDAPTMLALSAILLAMMLTRSRIERWEGALLIVLYGLYLSFGVVR